jgi:hypothetical protein
VIANNTVIHYSEANWPAHEVIEPRRWLVRPFAKVEFAAFFSKLLRHHRLQLDESASAVDVKGW